MVTPEVFWFTTSAILLAIAIGLYRGIKKKEGTIQRLSAIIARMAGEAQKKQEEEDELKRLKSIRNR